jgi:hypothetical protein
MFNNNALLVFIWEITYLERSNPISDVLKGQTYRLCKSYSNISQNTKENPKMINRSPVIVRSLHNVQSFCETILSLCPIRYFYHFNLLETNLSLTQDS